jgi:hypothetical protein
LLPCSCLPIMYTTDFLHTYTAADMFIDAYTRIQWNILTELRMHGLFILCSLLPSHVFVLGLLCTWLQSAALPPSQVSNFVAILLICLPYGSMGI